MSGMTIVPGMSVGHLVTGMRVDRLPVVLVCHGIHVTFEIRKLNADAWRLNIIHTFLGIPYGISL
jgi:hypothetical protein